MGRFYFCRFGVGVPGRFLFCVRIGHSLDQTLSGLIFETAEENHDQIQNPADAAQAEGTKPDNAGEDLANVETVDSQLTQKQAEPEGSPFLFELVASIIDICVVVDDIDYRLLSRRLLYIVRFCTAVGAERSVLINGLTAVFTVHNVTSVSLMSLIVGCHIEESRFRDN